MGGSDPGLHGSIPIAKHTCLQSAIDGISDVTRCRWSYIMRNMQDKCVPTPPPGQGQQSLQGPAALFCLLSNMRNVQQSASDSRNSLSQMAVNRRLNLKFSLDVRNLLISHNVRKFRWSLGFKKNENGYKISSFIMNNVCTQLNWNVPARTAGGTSSSSSSHCGGLTSSSGIPRARQSTLPCQNGLKMLRTQCLHS